MTDDERWMEVALAEAARAPEHGDVPIGCVIVSADGEECGRGRNRREVDHDPSAHAEIVALRAASQRIGQWRLDGATAYVSLEPCPMCAGAFVNARIARLVYGATDPKAGAVHSLFNIGADLRLNHRFESSGGVLADQSVALLRAFFGELRAQGQR
jgi:tRNA(adenine34) deaminase